MEFITLFLPTLGTGAIVAAALVPILLRLSHRLKWYDGTNDRKIHTGRIPHTGGMAIFAAASAALAVSAMLVARFGTYRWRPSELICCATAVAVVHLAGILDDFADIRARFKLFFQTAAALIIVISGHAVVGIVIPGIPMTIALGPAGYVLTVLWLVGMSNALNFVDGMDGLSGGISVIAALSFGLVFAVWGDLLSAAVAFALAGAVMGFLVYNWPPAKIFMGDAGALFLGFVLGGLPLMEHKGTVPLVVLVLPVTLLVFPIMDTVAAILRRMRRRVPVHNPDREHTHHKLLDLGFSPVKALMLLYGMTVFSALPAVLWAVTGRSWIGWLAIPSFGVSTLLFYLLDRRYRAVRPDT